MQKPGVSDHKRTVFITGAAAGLARGVAFACAGAGYEVAFTFRPQGTTPKATLDLLSAGGYSAHVFPVDFLADEQATAITLRDIDAQICPDILIHAVGPMRVATFQGSTMHDYHEMIDGNLRSAVQTAAAVLPGMRARGFGRLVFFGLNGSHRTQPARGLALHAAAKAGLVAFARSLAMEEGAHGITVNVVEPGDIRQKYRSRVDARLVNANNPVGRPGSWEDVADAVLFLVREDADFLTGAVLSVGGGLIDVYERT